MRILIVHANATIIGGAELYLRSAIHELVRRGHEVGLLHEHASRRENAILDSGFRTWSADLGSERITRELTEWGPSVLYFNLWRLPLLESALIGRYPSIYFAHDYSRSCPTGSKCYAFPSDQPCFRVAGPACLALHYPRRCGGLNPVTAWQQLRRQSEQVRLLARHCAVIAGSRHMLEELSHHGVDRSRLHLAPLFPTEFSPDSHPPDAREPQGKLLMVGRLVPLKGTRNLIQALPLVTARLPFRVSLTVAGRGPEEPYLRRLARSLNADVEFIGWAERDQLDALRRDSDLSLTPSLWPEPFGLSGLEAGCVGLPSVAYASGGVLDWLIPGQSGELAPADPPTPVGLADAIVRALSDSSHYQRLRRGAWEVAKRFSIGAHVSKLETIMEQVANADKVCT